MQSIFQKKALIFSIIFFILAFVFFIYLYGVIKEKKEISQIAQEKWQEETTHRENAKSLASSIKAITSERILLETHFVPSSNIVSFLDTIEKLAENVGAKSEVSSVDMSGDKSTLVVEMKAQGSFEIIYKLVTLLENSPYELDFILVDIKSSDTATGKVPQWTATFRMELLSFVN